MKRSTSGRKKISRWQRRTGNVPSVEEFLTSVFDSMNYHPGNEKPQRISATDKLHFRQTDLHPERMGLPTYRRIVRKLLDQHLVALRALGEPLSDLIEVEIRLMLRRYENLLPVLTSGHAKARQVRWSLCVRFVVPWIALRIAFRLRHRPNDDDERWFLPSINGRKIGSCFMQVVDRYVRRKSETQEAMAERLCQGQKVGGFDAARNLGRDFNRYRKGESTPSDARLDFIAGNCPQTPRLLAMMILARAIDRNVQDVVEEFRNDALRLIKFFRLSFDHFKCLLQRLDSELPEEDERAWQFLQSQTFTGNTPFEADRYYPLTEIYPYGLARKISAELQNAGKNRRLAYVPTSPGDFDKGTFLIPNWKPMPDDIHEAVRKGNFAEAIQASQSFFTSTSRNAAETARMADWFSHTALMAYDSKTTPCPLIPPENDVPHVLEEAARLFRLAYERAKGTEKAQHGINYLRFLLTPERPKVGSERLLAWKLHRVAAKYYQELGHEGSSAFLLGCLYWLEGKEKQGVREFLRAVECGRASFAEYDWIHLLRYAPILAKKTTNKRALKKFLKVSELDGVLYRESSPRTNLLEKELRQHADADIFQTTFKPFPV